MCSAKRPSERRRCVIALTGDTTCDFGAAVLPEDAWVLRMALEYTARKVGSMPA